MRPFQPRNVLETIDNQKGKNSRSENFSQILDIFRSRLSCRENEKRQESREKRSHGNNGYRYDLLRKSHSMPFLSRGLRNTESVPKIKTIDGTIKFSLPKIASDIPVNKKPISELT